MCIAGVLQDQDCEKHYCSWRSWINLQAIKFTRSPGSLWLQSLLPQIRDFNGEAGPFWAFLWGFMELRYGIIRLLWRFPELCVAKQVMLRRWALLAEVLMSFCPFRLSLFMSLSLFYRRFLSLSLESVWQFFSCPGLFLSLIFLALSVYYTAFQTTFHKAHVQS